MDVIIPTNLIYVLFDPAIPTSSFNFIHTCNIYNQSKSIYDFVCIPLRNFMGAPAPSAPAHASYASGETYSYVSSYIIL